MQSVSCSRCRCRAETFLLRKNVLKISGGRTGNKKTLKYKVEKNGGKKNPLGPIL